MKITLRLLVNSVRLDGLVEIRNNLDELIARFDTENTVCGMSKVLRDEILDRNVIALGSDCGVTIVVDGGEDDAE